MVNGLMFNVLYFFSFNINHSSFNILSFIQHSFFHSTLFFFFSNTIYKQGNTTSVNRVADINPPITTVAKGRCTSAPDELDKAIGRKPSEATVAVNKTGRNLTPVPFNTRS